MTAGQPEKESLVESPDYETGTGHEWDATLLKCCGECDETGWTACCLAYWLPCVAFGQTANRALQKSALAYALGFFALLSLAAAFNYAHRIFSYRARSCSHAPRSTGCTVEQSQSYMTAALLFFVAAVFFSLAVACWGASVRRAIREKFGIPGSRLEDWMTWIFCRCCAIAQEYRTIAYNNVDNGIWYGREELAEPLARQELVAPPAPQSMV